MALSKKEEDRLKEKYKHRLGEHISIEPAKLTANYMEFKKAFMPKNLSRYEQLCNLSEKITYGIFKPSKKTEETLAEQIRICHLGATPTGVLSFSYLAPVVIALVGILLSIFIFREHSTFFIMYFIVMGLVLVIVFQKLPEFFANTWRLKASNQMVQCIFYVVTYMRHTSNMELAVNFAAEHLSPPLSLDMKKVLWDVETERYSTIKESLDFYLEGWRKYNLEFIESFHLLEGSLYEPSEERRISLVEKALQVMLEETYEKMLHYSHELKGPVTLLYMLGIILPILGLVILPLVASFLTSGSTTPYMMAIFLAVLYNITLPAVILYMGKNILSKRPTGYGDIDITEQNPELKKYSNINISFGNSQIALNPLIVSGILLFIFLLIGLIPIWFHYFIPPYNLPDYYSVEQDYSGELGLNLKLLDYKPQIANTDKLIGPYGMIATMLGIFLIFGIGFSIGMYYKLKSQYLIQLRDNAKKLEQEFASALFQLGNRLGDGIPAELAFGKVAEMMKGTTSGDFFELVSMNITRLGIGIEKAIFDSRLGALIYFPSNLIESSMKVLVESVKKGPLIASQALINVSQYIKEIHRVNERVKDLLADILSDMKQQISVLAPAIAGIVVGITSMIVMIILKLTAQLRTLAENTQGASTPSGILQIFGDPIPTYYFQIIVGLYVIQVTYILTVLINGIENGSDKLGEQDALGKNLMRGTMLYCLITFLVVLTFNLLAAMILNNIQMAA